MRPCPTCLKTLVEPVRLCGPCMELATIEAERLARIFDAMIAGGISRAVADEVMLGYMERLDRVACH